MIYLLDLMYDFSYLTFEIFSAECRLMWTRIKFASVFTTKDVNIITSCVLHIDELEWENI